MDMCRNARTDLVEVSRALAQRDLPCARALTGCLLVQKGVTIGFENPNQDSAPLKRAANCWNQSLGVTLFRVGANPDLVVRVQKEVAGGDAQGEIDFEHKLDVNGTYETHGVIQVAADTAQGPMTITETAAVVTHELGHLLGLDDDPHGTGIMGDFDSLHLVTAPSKEEIASVKDLRADLFKLQEQVVTSEFSEPKQ